MTNDAFSLTTQGLAEPGTDSPALWSITTTTHDEFRASVCLLHETHRLL
jgi:hypothetical protein